MASFAMWCSHQRKATIGTMTLMKMNKHRHGMRLDENIPFAALQSSRDIKAKILTIKSRKGMS